MKPSTLIMVLLLATLAVAVTTPQSPFHLTGASFASESGNGYSNASHSAKSCAYGSRYSSYYRQCVRAVSNPND
jgi:hypothetical protein